jgi:predicted ATPase
MCHRKTIKSVEPRNNSERLLRLSTLTCIHRLAKGVSRWKEEAGEWRKFHNKEHHNLYSSLDNSKMINSRSIDGRKIYI